MKYLVGVVIGIAAVVCGLFAFSRPAAAPVYEAPTSGTVASTTPVSRLPWIEIEVAGATKSGSSAELVSGDELAIGDTVTTSATGRARIHFPDGSVARLDPSTEVVISDATYSDDLVTSSVHLSLLSGKLWSRVMSLLTKDSEWEVTTSNAVVTVRGTAFGVQFDKGKKKSLVVGSENQVAVRRRLQSESERTMEQEKKDALAVLVSPDMFVTLDGDEAVPNKSGVIVPEKIAPQRLASAIAGSDWVVRNKSSDRDDAALIESLKAGIQGTPDALPVLLREKLMEEQVQLRTELMQEVVPLESRVEPIEPIVKTAIQPLATTTKIGGVSVAGFVIIPDKKMAVLVEGDKILFAGYAVMSDGTKKNIVSTDVMWKVKGDIGTIGPRGVFTAALSPAVSEMGTAAGGVVAEWTDPVTKKMYSDASDAMTINAGQIVEPIDQRG